MIYFVVGASGVGKSTLLPLLRENHRDIFFHDFDDIGVPENADKRWRQQSTNAWLERGAQEDQNTCVLGGAVPGEIISTPFYINHKPDISLCLLDCNDEVRYQRLLNRASYGPNQDIMNWGCWLRLHAKHPKWEPHVIMDECWNEMHFEKMLDLDAWCAPFDINIIDNSGDMPDETAETLSKWLNKK